MLEFLHTYAPLVVGVLTFAIVEFFKRLPSIPVFAGHTAQLRTISAILSFLGSAVTAIVTGDPEALEVLGNSVASYLVAYASFKGFIPQPQPKEPVTPTQ